MITVRLHKIPADLLIVQFDSQPHGREAELARAHVRASSALSRGHSHLRKMAALIHREDAVGIIAERIIASDSNTGESVKRILKSVWSEGENVGGSLIGGAIEVFGWDLVREVALVALLHQTHVDLLAGSRSFVTVTDLDKQAIAMLTAGAALGVNNVAALVANVGTAGLAALGSDSYSELRRRTYGAPHELEAAEKSMFGFDHCLLGAAMLEDADMPHSICEATASHSVLGKPLWLAERIADASGYNGGLPQLAPTVGDDHFTSLGIRPVKLASIRRAIDSAVYLPEMYFSSSASFVGAA